MKSCIGVITFFVVGSILFAQSITVTSPVSGVNWEKDSHKVVSWNTTGISEGTYKITLWKGGVNLGVVKSGIPYLQHSLPWVVGNLENASAVSPGSGYEIKVKWQGQPVEGASGSFSITEPGMTLPTGIIRKPDAQTIMKVYSGRPDLEIVDVRAFPEKPKLNEDTVFRAFIINHNQASACEECHMNVRMVKHEAGRDRDVADYNVVIPRLEEGKTHYKMDFQFKFREAGSHTLHLLIDSHNAIRESNEYNNSYVFSENLDNIHSWKPELVITRFTHVARSCIFDDTIISCDVKNIGDTTAGPFTLYVICSPDKVRIKRIESLPPGTFYKSEFHFQWNSLGTKRIKAVVDRDNEVDEQNENNNEVTSSIQIITGTIFD